MCDVSHSHLLNFQWDAVAIDSAVQWYGPLGVVSIWAQGLLHEAFPSAAAACGQVMDICMAQSV